MNRKGRQGFAGVDAGAPECRRGRQRYKSRWYDLRSAAVTAAFCNAGLRPAGGWALGLVMLCVALLFACGGGKPAAKAPAPVRVDVVQEHTADSTLRYSAEIEPVRDLVLAFKAGGYVEDLARVRGADGRLRDIQEGDFVRQGTVLAQLRKGEYRAKTDGARAQVAEAQAAADQAGLDLARATKLFEDAALPKTDYDRARTQSELAGAKLAAAKAQLDAAEIALGDCNLAAPLDAVVLKREVERGALVGPGTPAFRLANLRQVKAVFGVSDRVVQQLRPGMLLTITTEAVAGEFSGRITRIDPAADPRSRLFEAELTIDNPDAKLKDGMIATILLGDIAPAKVAVVPLTAIVRSADSPDGYAVFVLEDANGHASVRRKDVQLGEAYGNTIGITAGIRIGDRVVISGPSLLVDGETVQVIP